MARELSSRTSLTAIEVAMLVEFNNEIVSWLATVLITQETEDIFKGERSVIGSGSQLLEYFKMTD